MTFLTTHLPTPNSTQAGDTNNQTPATSGPCTRLGNAIAALLPTPSAAQARNTTGTVRYAWTLTRLGQWVLNLLPTASQTDATTDASTNRRIWTTARIREVINRLLGNDVPNKIEASTNRVHALMLNNTNYEVEDRAARHDIDVLRGIAGGRHEHATESFVRTQPVSDISTYASSNSLDYFNGAFYIVARENLGNDWFVNMDTDVVATGHDEAGHGFVVDAGQYYIGTPSHQIRVMNRTDGSHILSVDWQGSNGTDDPVGLAADVEVTTGNRKVWFARSHGNNLRIHTYEYVTATTMFHLRQNLDFTLASINTRLGSAYTDLLTAADESSVVGVKAIGVRGAVLYLLVSAQHTESVQTHQVLVPYVIGGTGNALTLTASTDNNRIFGHVARPTDFVQYAAEKFAFIDDTQIVHFRELQSNDTIPQIEADDEDKVIGVNSDLEYELIEQTGGVPGGTDDQDASEVDRRY